MLSILGLYSGYLFYVGAVPLMKIAQEKAAIYTAAVVVAAFVLSLIAGAIIGSTGSLFAPSAPSIDDSSISGKLNVPGVGSVDMDKLNQATKRMEELGKQGSVQPVDIEKLKALLPAKLGNYVRGAVESSSMAAGGINGAQAEASYSNGTNSLRVSINDMAAVGALAGVGAALDVRNEREDANGFERTYSEDGGMVTERWDNAARSGEYSKAYANRFMVSIEGNANSFDELKGYASSIDGNALAALAR